jgi:phenylacetic acid degradation operon negative regulatory protein
MSNMSKNNDFSKKILKILSEKAAISLPEIQKSIEPQSDSKKGVYAITRSIKGLKEAGLIENIHSGQKDYARLTKEGKKKAHSIKLESDTSLLNPSWDGKWRIILLDLPESRKNERESLRYLLKKAGFVMLKNSAWVSPYPFEHLFMNIKKDLGLSTEIMILITDSLDEETEKYFFDNFMQ